MNYDWEPLVRLGLLEFDKGIAGLRSRGAVVLLCHDDSVGWDIYEYGGDAAEVHVEDGRIESVTCYEQCLYRGVNLIGMAYDAVAELLESSPTGDPDVILIDDEPQHVFEFDSVGAQVWVREGVVVTVVCGRP